MTYRFILSGRIYFLIAIAIAVSNIIVIVLNIILKVTGKKSTEKEMVCEKFNSEQFLQIN